MRVLGSPSSISLVMRSLGSPCLDLSRHARIRRALLAAAILREEKLKWHHSCRSPSTNLKSGVMERDMRPLSEEVVRILGQKYSADQKIRILDIACGAGEPSTTLAQKFPHFQIMATDFASGMIEAAKEYGKAYSNIQYAVADAQDLSQFESSTFDALTCVAALFAVADPQKDPRFVLGRAPDQDINTPVVHRKTPGHKVYMAVREFKRVLKPNGQAVITVWGTPQETQFAQSAFTTVARLLGDKAQEKKTPIWNLSDPKQFQKLLLEGGFSTVKISDFNLEISTSDSQIEEMREHPMMVMISNILVGGGIPREECWPKFKAEHAKLAEELGHRQDDGLMVFGKNVSYIAHAEA